MAFSGYLIKIGNYDTFFNRYIVSASYKVAKKIIDVDSYRDANGVLHRNAMDHLSYTIEFELKPLDNVRLETVMSAIRSNFVTAKERKLNVNFYVPEDDAYVTASCYMPDIEYTIDHLTAGKIFYKNVTLKFIGY